jgi:tetratricopeptide (TPR) repeat protein
MPEPCLDRSHRASAPRRLSNHDVAPAAASHGRSRGHFALVALLLFVALAMRLLYAHGLPLNGDETVHLREAAKFSLAADRLHLPPGSRLTNHPTLCVAITALADWLGGGSLFFVRATFVVINLVGVLGVYALARGLFGDRAALVAMGLAAVDRRWIFDGAQMLEPGAIAVVPWALLFMHRALTMQRVRDWLTLGVLIGIGFNFYELVLLLLIPLGAYVLVFRRLRAVFASAGVYVFGAAVVLLAAPYVVWNLASDAPQFAYAAMRTGALGLSPRVLLLYFGDVLIGLRDSTWLMMTWGTGSYTPRQLPCFTVAGVLYLAGVVWSLRRLRDERYALLLLTIVGIAVPVTLVAPDEWYSNFWYATFTLVPAIVLTAALADRLLRRRSGGVAVGIGGLVLAACAVVFLIGPKWGYFSPFWEKAYIGRIFWDDNRPLGQGEDEQARIDAARTVTDEALRRHPESVIAQYVRARLARNPDERAQAVGRIVAVDRFNPLLVLLVVEEMRETGQFATARDLLEQCMDQSERYFGLLRALAEVELELEDYEATVRYAREALARKPDAYEMYRVLFFAYDATGRGEEAEQALRAYVLWSFAEPAEAYVRLARECERRGWDDRMARLLEAAVAADPNRVEARVGLGVARMKAGRFAEALAQFEAVLQIEPQHAQAARMAAAARDALADTASDRASDDAPRPATGPAW